MLQRDAFIRQISERLGESENVFFLSADFGAAALDALREEHPSRFIHCGISEQAMVDIATGLALEGNVVFAYAMAPFLSLRALEQIKCGPGIMNLPVALISVGVGLGYADSGPTHYATEDFACLRSIVGCSVYTVSDESVAKSVANHILDQPHFSYIRLDRNELPILGIDPNIALGFRLFGNSDPSVRRVALVSHGKMVHSCVNVAKRHPDKFFAVDLIRAKPFPVDLLSVLRRSARAVVTVDEQTPYGSIGSTLLEFMASEDCLMPLERLTLPEEYVFQNGGREFLLSKFGLDEKSIESRALEIYGRLT